MFELSKAHWQMIVVFVLFLIGSIPLLLWGLWGILINKWPNNQRLKQAIKNGDEAVLNRAYKIGLIPLPGASSSIPVNCLLGHSPRPLGEFYCKLTFQCSEKTKIELHYFMAERLGEMSSEYRRRFFLGTGEGLAVILDNLVQDIALKRSPIIIRLKKPVSRVPDDPEDAS